MERHPHPALSRWEREKRRKGSRPYAHKVPMFGNRRLFFRELLPRMGILKSPRGQCHRCHRLAVCFVLRVFFNASSVSKRRPASSIEPFWLWTKRRQLADVAARLFLRRANVDDFARLLDRHVKRLIAFEAVQR